ncbi:hypothetical protein EHS25_003517 [Saitozyma podzolica]|uniref:Ricin B lectin domain-containing protein n=1 Tax=Saitozyma podzolica TaxID=1890683 RepID=A0A427Y7G9_9TREE|nr:hypothetical protein EHS25_003517 [Saitozyma podzolica]
MDSRRVAIVSLIASTLSVLVRADSLSTLGATVTPSPTLPAHSQAPRDDATTTSTIAEITTEYLPVKSAETTSTPPPTTSALPPLTAVSTVPIPATIGLVMPDPYQSAYVGLNYTFGFVDAVSRPAPTYGGWIRAVQPLLVFPDYTVNVFPRAGPRTRRAPLRYRTAAGGCAGPADPTSAYTLFAAVSTDTPGSLPIDPEPTSDKQKLAVGLGVAGGVIALVLMGVTMLFVRKKRRMEAEALAFARLKPDEQAAFLAENPQSWLNPANQAQGSQRLLVTAATALAAPHHHHDTHLVSRALAPGFDTAAVTLSPANNPNLCLGTLDPPGNDVELYLISCDTSETFWGAWDIQPGNNVNVKLSGTNFCLDAGLPPKNNGPAKLYTCFQVPQQQWYYTPDLHIAITGGDQCLDYEVICGLGGCAPGTRNPPAFHRGPDPPQWRHDEVPHPDRTVQQRSAPGLKGQTGASLQLFDINRGAGQIKATGSNFCLDSTTQFPPNGQGLKLWTCYSGLPQQNWYYTGDNHIAITGGTACADVKREDGTTFQVWGCSGTDPQQT